MAAESQYTFSPERIKHLCDVCGEEKYDGVTTDVGGMNDVYELANQVFGKTVFFICYICWLKALGVKPKEE